MSSSPDQPAPLIVRELEDAQETALATAWLDWAERAAGVPLVDEKERDRLTRLQQNGTRETRWRSLAAQEQERIVGYGAVVVPERTDGHAAGDVAVGSGTEAMGSGAEAVSPAAVRSALLRELHHLVVPEQAASLQVWMRHVTDQHLDGVEADGFVVARRLGILGRDLTDEVEHVEVAGVTVRAYDPARDDDAVVETLALAYDGTGDGGWTHERFADRKELPWFREDDLLLAEDDASGRVLGLHWLKRRGGGVGEVYNLAIHPDGQGRGLGGLLLAAGLNHLRATGCHDVLLWVDRANQRAVELYTGRGFTTRWDDVALDVVSGR